MKYIQRGKSGAITAVYDIPQIGQEAQKAGDGSIVLVDGAPVMIEVDYAPEHLADDNAEVVAWLAAQRPRVYVARDVNGAICDVCQAPNDHASEPLAADHPDIVRFHGAQELSARNARIDSERDAALAGAVDFQGRRFHIDQTFQVHLAGLITAFGVGLLAPDAKPNIRTFDNEIVQLGLDDLKGLAGAVLARVQTIYQESWTAKDALQ